VPGTIDNAACEDRDGVARVTAPAVAKSGLYASCKVAADSVAALVLLFITAPLMVLAALLVKLSSKGPVIYMQVRLGRDGLPFTIYKFRSMYHNCESESGPTWCQPNDTRIFPAGRFLRASHLDELPQLWNVLRGEMSLVGPRPERPEIISQLQEVLPQYPDRMRIRPGVTGLAQVQLKPDTDIDSVRRKLACDLYYVQRVGLWLDLRILLSTTCAVVGIPFAVPRALLRVPSGSEVEEAYRDRSARIEPVFQMQSS